VPGYAAEPRVRRSGPARHPACCHAGPAERLHTPKLISREGQGAGTKCRWSTNQAVICLLSWLSPVLSASQDRKTTERSQLLSVPGEACKTLLTGLHAVMIRLQLDLLKQR